MAYAGSAVPVIWPAKELDPVQRLALTGILTADAPDVCDGTILTRQRMQNEEASSKDFPPRGSQAHDW